MVGADCVEQRARARGNVPNHVYVPNHVVVPNHVNVTNDVTVPNHVDVPTGVNVPTDVNVPNHVYVTNDVNVPNHVDVPTAAKTAGVRCESRENSPFCLPRERLGQNGPRRHSPTWLPKDPRNRQNGPCARPKSRENRQPNAQKNRQIGAAEVARKKAAQQRKTCA